MIMSTYKRKTDFGVTDFHALVKAMKDIKIGRKSIRATAVAYNIPKSSLIRYASKFDKELSDIEDVDDEHLLEVLKRIASFPTASLVFNAQQEKALVEYILTCSKHYYGLSITELRQLAHQFAKKIKIKYPETWDADDKAGKIWYYGFMNRNKQLTLRTPEQTSLNRAKTFCKANVDAFFHQLDAVFEKTPYQPASIWNMDETGFSTVPTKVGKVISLKGARRVGQMASAERGTMITMALAVNAAGISVAPFFLFPRQNMQAAFLDNAAPGTVAFANGSGWMQQSDFVRFVQHFTQNTKASIASPVLLLLDNHTSHLSIEALDLAAQNGVTLLSFPPHCSHRMQPLDVSVYGPVKTYYKTQCNAWQRTNAGKAIEIRHIVGIVCKSLDMALSPQNIKAGFAASGICPFNPDIFMDSDFVQAELSGESLVAASTVSQLDKDEQRRIIPSTSSNHPVGNVAAFETVSTSEDTSTISRATSLQSVLSDIGPLQRATPKKPSNRGRKPMKSTILTSPENIALLKEQREKRESLSSKKAIPKDATSKKATPKKAVPKKSPPKIAAPKKSPPKRAAPKRAASMKAEALKRAKLAQSSSSSSSSDADPDDDLDFCIICFQNMPRKLTVNNSIECNTCKRAVHLKCANMKHSYFTCHNCNSDSDVD